VALIIVWGDYDQHQRALKTAGTVLHVSLEPPYNESDGVFEFSQTLSAENRQQMKEGIFKNTFFFCHRFCPDFHESLIIVCCRRYMKLLLFLGLAFLAVG